MSAKRIIEIFTADCPCCDEAVGTVKRLACPSCEVQIVDMRADSGGARGRELGVRSVPAVAVDGELASCCFDRGVDSAALRSAGVGTPLE